MSISLNPPYSTELIKIYDNASKKTLKKSPEQLFLTMRDKKLGLEERGFLPWVKRVLFRRADKEYNFVKNLDHFQKLIEGALIELQSTEVTPEDINKIEDLTLLYNKFLECKQKKNQDPAIKRYAKRVHEEVQTKPFNATRILEKIPLSPEDPVLKFMKLVPQIVGLETISSLDKAQLDLLVPLLAKGSSQRKSISEAYTSLQSRIKLLEQFTPHDPSFEKARKVLQGNYIQIQPQGKELNLEIIKSYIYSINESLDATVKQFFADGLKKIQEVDTARISLAKKIAQINGAAEKLGFSERFVMDTMVEPKKLDEFNEANLEKLKDTIDKTTHCKKQEEEKFSAFCERVREFQKLRDGISAKILLFTEHKKLGFAAEIVAEKWLKELNKLQNDLQENGLESKSTVIESLAKYTEEKFKEEMKTEMSKQGEGVVLLESLMVDLLPQPKSLLNYAANFGQTLSQTIGLTKPNPVTLADRSYGLIKLVAETNKAIIWYKCLQKLTKSPEDTFPFQGGETTLLKLIKELENSTEPSPEKIKSIFDAYRKLVKINSNIQRQLEESNAPIIRFIRIFQKSLDRLEKIQEKIGIFAPLISVKEPGDVQEYEELKKKCWNTWDLILTEFMDNKTHIEALQTILTTLNKLDDFADTFIGAPWALWQRGVLSKESYDSFKKKTSQEQARYIALHSKLI